MENILEQLFENKILIATLLAWFIAQLAKAILETIMNRKWSWQRFFVGSGGMPSSHAALVCSLTTAALIVYGLGSFQFAISLVFTFVVLHDARGVRLETGKQSTILNHMLKNLSDGEPNLFTDIELKELVGHTPLQVFVGALIGIITAWIVC